MQSPSVNEFMKNFYIAKINRKQSQIDNILTNKPKTNFYSDLIEIKEKRKKTLENKLKNL